MLASRHIQKRISCLHGSGSGLIPPNSRAVLIKLPTYREKGTTTSAQAPSLPPVPPTPRNSKALLHQARQAKLLLKSGPSLSSEKQVELVDLIDSISWFAIGTDRDLQLERETNRKWRETQKLMTAESCKHQLLVGKVLDAATLKYLYEERKRIDSKKAAKAAKATTTAGPCACQGCKMLKMEAGSVRCFR